MARAGELLTRVEQIEAELAAQAGEVTGTVRVAAFQTAALALAMPVLDRLAEAHPGLRVELVEEEAERSLPLLARGGVDVAIAEEYDHAPRPTCPSCTASTWTPTRCCWRWRPAASTPARSHWRRCATPRGRPPARGPRTPTCSPASAAPSAASSRRSAIGSNDMRLLLELVAGDRAAALVPALGRPERDPRVSVHRVAEGRFSRALFVAVRAGDRERPSTAAVVAAIREARPAG